VHLREIRKTLFGNYSGLIGKAMAERGKLLVDFCG